MYVSICHMCNYIKNYTVYMYIHINIISMGWYMRTYIKIKKWETTVVELQYWGTTITIYVEIKSYVYIIYIHTYIKNHISNITYHISYIIYHIYIYIYIYTHIHTYRNLYYVYKRRHYVPFNMTFRHSQLRHARPGDNILEALVPDVRVEKRILYTLGVVYSWWNMYIHDIYIYIW